MNTILLKNIRAILAGFLFVIAASIATDMLLIKTGLMKQPFHLNSVGFIIGVIAYRSLFGVIGSYLTARLAPRKPMRLAMIGGFIGFIVAILGAAAMWDIPPHWYPITLIITTLPCAWLGAYLFVKRKRQHPTEEDISMAG